MNRIIILIALLILGCSEQPRQKTIEELYEVAIAHGADAEDVKSFDNLPQVAEAVNNATTLTVYEGVSREVLGEKEWKADDAVKVDGFYFLKAPFQVSKESNAQLWDQIASKETFWPFSGLKMCGGFHPDWCLVVGTEDGPVNLHLCFGCQEMMAIKNGERLLYCDFARGMTDKLDKLLVQLRWSRRSN